MILIILISCEFMSVIESIIWNAFKSTINLVEVCILCLDKGLIESENWFENMFCVY